MTGLELPLTFTGANFAAAAGIVEGTSPSYLSYGLVGGGKTKKRRKRRKTKKKRYSKKKRKNTKRAKYKRKKNMKKTGGAAVASPSIPPQGQEPEPEPKALKLFNKVKDIPAGDSEQLMMEGVREYTRIVNLNKKRTKKNEKNPLLPQDKMIQIPTNIQKAYEKFIALRDESEAAVPGDGVRVKALAEKVAEDSHKEALRLGRPVMSNPTGTLWGIGGG